jgi:succinate-semialdehyde dehydrogenase/glutarate-semialdehyde dehydrogenase
MIFAVTTNPTTNENRSMAAAQTPEARAQDAQGKARAAFYEWSEKPLKDRLDLVRTIRYRLAESSEALAEAIAKDMGKSTKAAMMGEVLPALDSINNMLKGAGGALADKSVGTGLGQFYLGSRSVKIHRQPFGVVLVIGTWNYPLLTNIDPIVAAIIAGNTVVWKPSEFMPNTTRAMTYLFEALPQNVVHFVEGGPDMGQALTLAAVDKIVFTGSTVTGRKIMAQAAHHTTPLELELGGKDAMIVLEDADMAAAIKACLWGMCNNAGQTPVKPARIFVHGAIYDAFKEQLLKKVTEIKVGHVEERDTQLGPLMNDPLTRFAEMIVTDATKKGARLLVGGHRMTDIQGHFFAPTVLEGVTDSMRLEQEDIWAPIITLRKFDNTSQAVRWVNSHKLGLTASVWGKNPKATMEVAKKLDIGTIMLNNVSSAAADMSVPFGGRRMSGFGLRHGAWSVASMTRPQVISVSKGVFKPPYVSRATFQYKWALMLIALKSGQYKKLMNLLKAK